jgi:two-component system, cell cycle response regulator
MAQNILQSDNAAELEARSISVRVLGFEAIDEESFSRFFQVARVNKPTYVTARPNEKDSSDILVVNYDNPTALKERDEILSEHSHIQVVAVSRGPLDEPPAHHIRGMLFAARVLTTLDKVVPETASSAPQGALESAVAAPTTIKTPEPQVQPLSEDKLRSTPNAALASPQLETGSIEPQDIVSVMPQVDVVRTPPIQDVSVSTDTLIPAPASSASTEAEGYRALVVDDSVAIQKSLEINLATLPQINKIDFADSGESALEKAEAMQYDLIFLDVMMPGIDGYETCTRLRKKPEYKKTPIIMVSGKTSPLDEVKGVMAGCTTYLTKPVQQEAFQKLGIRVLSWLEKQKKP